MRQNYLLHNFDVEKPLLQVTRRDCVLRDKKLWLLLRKWFLEATYFATLA